MTAISGLGTLTFAYAGSILRQVSRLAGQILHCDVGNQHGYLRIDVPVGRKVSMKDAVKPFQGFVPFKRMSSISIVSKYPYLDSSVHGIEVR